MLKKMAIVLVLIIGLGALWLGAVGLDESQRTDEVVVTSFEIDDYFPAEPGMRWEYQGEGMEYASFTREVLYRDGDLVQIMVDNGGTRMAQIYEIKEDRVIRQYAEAEVYDDRNLLASDWSHHEFRGIPADILRLPGESDTWTSLDGTVTSTLVSWDAVVQTPAGTFEDVIVILNRHQGSTGEVYEYYAPNVGLVKQEFNSEGYIVTSELVRFITSDGTVLEAQQSKQDLFW